MNITNQLIRDRIAAIEGVYTSDGKQLRPGLVDFKLVSRKACFNAARTLKYLKDASNKIEEERKSLFRAMFGEVQAVKADHPRYAEFNEGYLALMREETEVEKVFAVTLDELAVVDGTAAVPADVLAPLLDFMVTAPETE
jgi:hypothetical protein